MNRLDTRGFSLIEVLIVLAILALISSMGVGFYFNYGKSIEMNSVAQTIVFDLKQAQSKAMTGEGTLRWGIHFFNTTTDYYEVFSTPTDYSDAGKAILSKNYLGSGVTFSNPGSGSATDIIFNRISGTAASSSIIIISQNNIRTINVSIIGAISVQ